MTRRWRAPGLVTLLLLGTGVLAAQFPEFGRGREPELLPNTPYDGAFVFVRIQYDAMGRGGGRRRGFDPMWNHDYPRAEIHFGKILEELSLVRTYLGGSNVFRLDDPELTRYPVAYLTEPGAWSLTQAEALGLRNYLLKGGFIIFDDFAGNDWYNLVDVLRIVLPDARPVRLDASHPIFDSFFRIASLEMYHPYRGVPSEFWGIYENNDPDRRLLAIINYNNDMTEYWEWSDQDFAPIELTNEAYKLGVNYVVYAMTH